MIGEAKRVYTIGAVPTARLEKYNGIRAPAPPPAPRLADRLRPGPFGDYFLSVGRLETLKRVDLAIRASRSRRGCRSSSSWRATARERDALRRDRRGGGRRRPRRVPRRGGRRGRSCDLYAGCRAVIFAPFDEDYGYVTLEAFLSGKPVITADDSGGPLEFVEDGVTGCVTAPTPAAVADAMALLAGSPARRPAWATRRSSAAGW